MTSDNDVLLVAEGSSIANTTDTDFSSVKVSTVKYIQLKKGNNSLEFELPVAALTKLRYFKFEFQIVDENSGTDSQGVGKAHINNQKTVSLQIESVSLKGMKNAQLTNVPVVIGIADIEQLQLGASYLDISDSYNVELGKTDSFLVKNKDKIEIKPVLFYRVNFPVFLLFSIFIYSVFYLFFRVLVSEKQRDHVKTPDLVMIIILCFLLIVPLVCLNYSKDLDRIENRVLAKLPAVMNADNKLNLNLGSDLDSYFNDRFGLRHFFIRIKDYIYSYNKVGVAPSAEGKIYGILDDWYYVDGLLKLTADEKLLEKEKLNLIEVSKHYNCPVYVLVYPFKSHIYKEALAPIYKNHELVLLNESDKIARYFNDSVYESLKAIDLTPLFIRSKEEYADRLLYYKDDHHQTEWGAYLAAKAFVSSVTGSEFDSMSDPEFERHLGFMDIYSIEPLFTRGISYQRLAIRSKKQLRTLKDYYYYLSTTSQYKEQIDHTKKSFRVYEYLNKSPMLDKTILAVGNSYVANTGRMLAYFAKDTWQYNFYAGKGIETSLYDVDKELNGRKVDYVVVAYFTNAVMSEIVKK
ncbi:MAG: hypothetical protein ACI4NE_04965 [Succinivibrio sp.]